MGERCPHSYGRLTKVDRTPRAHRRRLARADERGAPRCWLPAAVDYCFHPVHAEFTARTAWSLYNAVTETLKSLPPTSAFQSAARVGRFFETRLK